MKEFLKIRLSRIREAAHILDAPGYYDEYVSQGTISADGKFLHVAAEVRTQMRAKYPWRGAGDHIARIARPVARFIDGVLHTDFQNCDGCKRRQNSANQAFPLNPPKT